MEEIFDYAIINESIAPLKSTSDNFSETTDELIFGMIVKILKKQEEWYYVETDYDYCGYVNRKSLLIDNQRAGEWRKIAKAHVYKSFADIMVKPYYQSNILKTVTRGAILSVTGKTEDNWKEVELPDKTKAWIKAPFLEEFKNLSVKEDEDKIRENLVYIAKQYLGVQYRWGGKTPMGIDCSGLCSMAYMLNGITIYRDAELKEKYMKSISIDKIKPGDLIFFPGHVAMYIGDNRYIHSTGKSHGVTINSLKSDDFDFREDLIDKITAIGTIFDL
ncbi:C40 family peptidase [Clostridium sp. 19966]|uniref:C40 family peptidase n=1 Tax=Clostridium sp. 19966 TaxID=2768166 RepID=UPI0028DD68F8|nr:NlpC/P60 family protein [Clostridium sp. 19966]MDT8717432.1 C40 family peptidase [Clostridium sp. 19966]